MTLDENELIQPPEAAPPPEAALEKPPVWSGWATFGLGAAVLAVETVAQMAVMLVIVLWAFFSQEAPAFGAYLDDLLAAIEQAMLDHMGLIISLTTIVGMFVSVGMILLLIKAKKGASIREYLALRPISGRTVLALVGVVVLLLVLSELVGLTVDDSVGIDLVSGSYGTSVWPALFWIALAVGAPVAEEVLFRGFLFQGFLHSRLGLAGTIIVTSLAWAVLHVQYQWQFIGFIFVMGVAYGYVRYKTRSLWSVLLLHGLNNLAAVIMLAFGVDSLR